jgi:hypothetical protein
LAAGLVAVSPGIAGAGTGFFGAHSTISKIGTTVPTNGDVNPYGVAVVPASVGRLHMGDILVSNFNNKKNLQGTGTTIVKLPAGGLPANTPAPVFARVRLDDDQRCPGGVGLTTALAVFPSGWVVVGSLPTKDGTSATARAGCLIVLDAWGNVVRTIHGGLINGPWDLTATQFGDDGVLFVSNVLNGITPTTPLDTPVDQGTVVRVVLDLGSPAPQVESETVVASGFGEETDAAALVIGPTGLGLSHDGRVLYVADAVANGVSAVHNPLGPTGPMPGTGTAVSTGGALNTPLGLTVAPNGDILTMNGGDGNGVETAPNGMQVATLALDTSGQGGGTLFGLALKPHGDGLYYVDDGDNTLDVVQ